MLHHNPIFFIFCFVYGNSKARTKWVYDTFQTDLGTTFSSQFWSLLDRRKSPNVVLLFHLLLHNLHIKYVWCGGDSTPIYTNKSRMPPSEVLLTLGTAWLWNSDQNWCFIVYCINCQVKIYLRYTILQNSLKDLASLFFENDILQVN